jgi:imidazoleglycerol-phosphate dehydratase/histidinol-phosphatase
MKNRAVLIFLEGAVLCEDRTADFPLVPGVIGGLASLVRQSGFGLILATPATSEANKGSGALDTRTRQVCELLAGEGVRFSKSVPFEAATGSVRDLLQAEGYELQGSCIVSGATRSLEVARSGLPVFQVDPTDCASWSRVAQQLIAGYRCAALRRKTKETDINLELSLAEGRGVSISTGLGFFDHMLTLFAVHAGFSLQLDAVGDLHVDEHHLVEDVGLVLGQTLAEALGDKRGIRRYGFLLPMDESLAEVAVDLSGRFEFVWDVSWVRERIGEMPTEMIRHFFKSLAETLRCSLHMKVRGENEHHKAEALFKALGRALRDAASRDPFSVEVPSSKGVL